MSPDKIESELKKELQANSRLAALLVLHLRHTVRETNRTAYKTQEAQLLNRQIGMAQGVDQLIHSLTKDDAAIRDASEYDLLKEFIL